MAIWDDLSIVLARLADQDPRPLTHWPQPGSRQNQPPPFRVGLAAWATATAEELHQRFGPEVELTVGALRYPQRTLPQGLAPPGQAALPQLDPAQIRAALDGPLSIRSGHWVRHGLLVANLTSQAAEIDTSGELIPDIVDTATGAVIASGCHRAPALIAFDASDSSQIYSGYAKRGPGAAADLPVTAASRHPGRASSATR